MWWPFWTSKPKEEPRAVSREDRKACWEARDTYFACLDTAGLVKGKEGVCTAQKNGYEGNCAKSWVEYFDQRRVIADAQKHRLAQAGTQRENAKSGR